MMSWVVSGSRVWIAKVSGRRAVRLYHPIDGLASLETVFGQCGEGGGRIVVGCGPGSRQEKATLEMLRKTSHKPLGASDKMTGIPRPKAAGGRVAPAGIGQVHFDSGS